MIKLIFAVLDVSLTMGLTRCYKTGFYIYICSLCTYFLRHLLDTLVNGGNLFAHQSWMRYLNPRLR